VLLLDYCSACTTRPPARRLAGFTSRAAGAVVLGALIVLLMEALARVPIVCCYYDAVALAALTALLVEVCSAQTGHFVLWCSDGSTILIEVWTVRCEVR
jgi:hypothetical protein